MFLKEHSGGVPSKAFTLDRRVSTEDFTVSKVAIKKHSVKYIFLLLHSVKFNMASIFCVSYILQTKKEGDIAQGNMR